MLWIDDAGGLLLPACQHVLLPCGLEAFSWEPTGVRAQISHSIILKYLRLPFHPMPTKSLPGQSSSNLIVAQDQESTFC